jgi:hypothetical protein
MAVTRATGQTCTVRVEINSVTVMVANEVGVTSIVLVVMASETVSVLAE